MREDKIQDPDKITDSQHWKILVLVPVQYSCLFRVPDPGPDPDPPDPHVFGPP